MEQSPHSQAKSFNSRTKPTFTSHESPLSEQSPPSQVRSLRAQFRSFHQPSKTRALNPGASLRSRNRAHIHKSRASALNSEASISHPEPPALNPGASALGPVPTFMSQEPPLSEQSPHPQVRTGASALEHSPHSQVRSLRSRFQSFH